MQVDAGGGVVQVEGRAAGQRLAPQETVIPAQCRAMRVGVTCAGVGPEVERGVDHCQTFMLLTFPMLGTRFLNTHFGTRRPSNLAVSW